MARSVLSFASLRGAGSSLGRSLEPFSDGRPRGMVAARFFRSSPHERRGLIEAGTGTGLSIAQVYSTLGQRPVSETGPNQVPRSSRCHTAPVRARSAGVVN